jgi:integrase/recombinase XerD
MDMQNEFDQFLQHCGVERRLSECTISAYQFDLLDFRKWLPRDRSLCAARETDLRSYLDDMVSLRSLSAATVRRRMACLRGFFRYQVEQGRGDNPFYNWQPKLPRRKRLPRALARSEVISILETRSRGRNGSQDIQAALCLMVATGLRVGELCRIKVDDMSPDCSMIRVHGKGSRERIVYVTDQSLRSDLVRVIFERRLRDCDSVWLLTNRLGKRMRPQSIRAKLKAIAIVSGIKRRITPHMLRHTAATLLIETGTDIRFVQRLLGHSSIATTELYTHVTDEALRSSLARADVLSNLRAA